MRAISILLLWAGMTLAQGDPLVQGIQAFDEGRYSAAERHLEQALQIRDDPKARLFLALTQAATGRCPSAEPQLLDAFEKSPDDSLQRLAGLGVARCRIAAKRFAAAILVLDQLRQQYPADADVLYEAARAHLKAWNDVIFEMFEKSPASFRVNQLSAEIFEIQGQHAEAVREYNKALEKSPHTLNLHYRLGRALLMQSHSPEAQEAARREFEAELELNPNDAVAEYQVAQILQAQQQHAEAVARLEKAVALDPQFSEALVALGRARAGDQRYEEAIQLLERAVELTPRNEGAHYALMVTYRNAGRPQDALRLKKRLEQLQQAPEGEFSDFLKRIGEPSPQP